MRKTLSKSEIKQFNADLFARFGLEVLDKKDLVQNIDGKYLSVNGEIYFFMHENQWIPTLKLIAKRNFLRTVVVDMGAVKFVVGGADIMRPGIVEVQQGIKEGDLVAIVDVNNRKPIAIGRAVLSSQLMHDAKTGRMIMNIHYVGDAIWKMSP